MTRIFGQFLLTAFFTALLSGSAAAACYADYKAKQDDPLELHYGVIELPMEFCTDGAAAENVVAGRIAVEGWKLLTVVSTFDESGLEERQESAGEFYLRY